MRYKNFLYLSRRYKNELNEKTPCKYHCSFFTVSSLNFSGSSFSSLEKHYKDRISIWEKSLDGILQRKQLERHAAQKERTRTIENINRSLDYCKRCLMLLDFYKKV